MIYFTSDHHFGHANVIKYCSRPFSSVEEMNEKMIASWNETVKSDDDVYYLGDFSLSKKYIDIVKKLNGRVHLIPGNHDSCFHGHKKHQKEIAKYLDAGFADVSTMGTMVIAGFTAFLYHLPYLEPGAKDVRYSEHRLINDGRWLLCGHVHEKWMRRGNMINVGVDVWDFKPVSLKAIEKIMIKIPEGASER